MKHIRLDEHSDSCIKFKETNNNYFNPYLFCHLNPENFLFYFQDDFLLITYFKCITHKTHIDFGLEIVQLLTKNKKREIYDLYKSEKLGDVYKNIVNGKSASNKM